jgi:NEDD8-activating enzyme E1 regulatory subunit
MMPSTQNRYDRQIRLWGAHGQARLESSKLCVLGAGPICTEALKNLVLGGIYSFMIVDNKNVSQEDLRNNFFFDPGSLGKGRAEATCSLLRRLNDAVRGTFSDRSVDDIIKNSPEFLKDFSLVLVAQVCLDDVLTPRNDTLVSISAADVGTSRTSLRTGSDMQ